MSGFAHDVFELYARQPWRVRAHVRIRWLTCPFEVVAADVPEAGRILDVGCGHGAFSAYLALQNERRRVVGIDVAEDKILAATAAAGAAAEKGRTNLCFTLADAETVPEGPWDAIVVLDVLYLLQPERQEWLLQRCARALAPGGILVVKEVAARPRWKAAWNRMQENLSVRVLQITRGGKLWFLPPARHASWLVAQGLEVRERPIHEGFFHPHHLIVARRPR
ncbi:MAG TPA: class I SAM-dependent methyltransferase [Thermoanaerobaculia bacterium]|nr:class I SAM-dependent methyltransferase [Thermoanaerobaculia bacterium]